MKWNKLYNYPPSTRSTTDGLRIYEVGEQKLPSVTTILAATQSQEKMDSLKRWKDRVGEAQANSVKQQAASRGTAMHTHLEKYILGEGHVDLTETGKLAKSMADVIIKEGLCDLSEIWGSEVTLHYPGLYAGQTDLVGTYDYEDSIVDFKQTNKPKRRQWVWDYFQQLAAYALAHNELYGTEIEKGVILMCSVDCLYQEFVLEGDEFKRAVDAWLERVEKFIGLQNQTP